ncbi:MAG: WbqC family protein [Pseudomonadota bacterium]
MILSAGQPYFAPFYGFFYKISCSDIFVVLDCVQFPRGTTWLSRNRFKNDQGTLWMTIPVRKKGLGLQRINEVRISHEGRWAGKHLASLERAYANAPYVTDHMPFLKELFSEKTQKLADLNLTIIKYLMAQFRLKTRILLLSELDIHDHGSGLLIEICRKAKVLRFLAQAPARKYLDRGMFSEAGISLEFFTPPSPVYPQLWGDFIANLSAFDLLFTCGPKAVEMIGDIGKTHRRNGRLPIHPA